jgi:hypothetical protein
MKKLILFPLILFLIGILFLTGIILINMLTDVVASTSTEAKQEKQRIDTETTSCDSFECLREVIIDTKQFCSDYPYYDVGYCTTFNNGLKEMRQNLEGLDKNLYDSTPIP